MLPKGLKEREALRVRLPQLLASEFPEVRGRVKLLPNGPPVPYPVPLRVIRPDPAPLPVRPAAVKAAPSEELGFTGRRAAPSRSAADLVRPAFGTRPESSQSAPPTPTPAAAPPPAPTPIGNPPSASTPIFPPLSPAPALSLIHISEPTRPY